MLECMLQVRLADPDIFFRVLGPYGPRLLSLDKRQVVYYSIKGGMPPQNQANPQPTTTSANIPVQIL